MVDGTCSDKLDETSFYNILLLLAIIMSFAVGVEPLSHDHIPHTIPLNVAQPGPLPFHRASIGRKVTTR